MAFWDLPTSLPSFASEPAIAIARSNKRVMVFGFGVFVMAEKQ
jgi:hypothetical protein